MSIMSKLRYLLETKNAIKEALISKGAIVSATDTFRSYADKIRELQPQPVPEINYNISNNESGKITNNQVFTHDVVVTFENNIILKDAEGTVYQSGVTLTEEGTYTANIESTNYNLIFIIKKTAKIEVYDKNGIVNIRAGRYICTETATIEFNEEDLKHIENIKFANKDGELITDETIIQKQGENVYVIKGYYDRVTLAIEGELTIGTTTQSTVDILIRQAPTVNYSNNNGNGILENGMVFSNNTTLTFDGTATLNGNEYVSGTEISEEGHYVLKVINTDNITTTIEFTIKKTIDVVVSDESGIRTAEENGAYKCYGKVKLEFSEEDSKGITSIKIVKSGVTLYEYTRTENSEVAPIVVDSTMIEGFPASGVLTLYVEHEDGKTIGSTATTKINYYKSQLPEINWVCSNESGKIVNGQVFTHDLTVTFENNIILKDSDGITYQSGSTLKKQSTYTATIENTTQSITFTIKTTINITVSDMNGEVPIMEEELFYLCTGTTARIEFAEEDMKYIENVLFLDESTGKAIENVEQIGENIYIIKESCVLKIEGHQTIGNTSSTTVNIYLIPAE